MRDLPSFPFFARALGRVWPQFVILAVLTSGHVLLEFLPETQRHPAYPKALSFLSVWVAAWIVVRMISLLRETPFVETRLAPNLRPLVFLFARVLVYLLAFLIALDSIGVSITPLLASLGVGSLAVGLALQDTLGNLFSGFYLYLDRPIAIGDWIRLENGTEGRVIAIGWRSTHLELAGVNRVIIPNSKLSTSIVLNYSLPTSPTLLTVSVGVAYESDLDAVERIAFEAIRKVSARVPQYVSGDPAPFVRFNQFAESSVDLVLGVWTRSFPDQPLVRHELVKEIKRSFDAANIEIPYPKRVVQQLAISDTAH